MKKIILVVIGLVFVTSNIFADTIRVRVTESTPIYKRSIVQIPHTTYQEEQVQVPYQCRQNNVNTNSIGVDTIIGTIAGVAIGNQIGRGNGRTVAKIVGGITGATIANNMRQDSTKTCYRIEFRKIPQTTYSDEVEERLVGYKICGYLGGRKICKRTSTKQRYIYLNY